LSRRSEQEHEFHTIPGRNSGSETPGDRAGAAVITARLVGAGHAICAVLIHNQQ